jgi:parvulin-like peptidyl-prolyl isomerase
MVFHKKSKIITAIVLAAVLVLAGCAGGSKTPAVYAVVNGEEISREDFHFYLNLQRLHDPGLEFSKEDQLDILDFMIEERLLLAEARRRGLESDPEKAKADYEIFRAQITAQYFDGSETMYISRLQELDLTEAAILQLIEEYQLINSVNDDESSKTVHPDDEAIDLFYEMEKETLFSHGERRNVRHILINDENFPDPDDDADLDALAEELANDLYERLLAGADFADLAKEYSMDEGSANYGGEIGFFEKNDDIVPEFRWASFEAKTGEIIEPIKTVFGWHIIEVVEIQEPGYVELDADLREQIFVYLFNEDKKQRVNTMLMNLRTQAEIQINYK